MIDKEQAAIGGDDVDVVGAQLDSAFDLHDGHARSSREDGWKLSAMLRVQVDDHDKDRPGIVGQRTEHGLQGLNAACRGADRHYHWLGGWPSRLLGQLPNAILLIAFHGASPPMQSP